MSGAYELAEQAIRTRFDTLFTTVGVDKVLENEPYNPNPATPFVALVFDHAESNQISIGAPGNNLYRYYGTASFYIYTPKNKGRKATLSICATLEEIFRSQAFGGVLCFTPRLHNIRGDADSEGNFYGAALYVPFQFDKAD